MAYVEDKARTVEANYVRTLDILECLRGHSGEEEDVKNPEQVVSTHLDECYVVGGGGEMLHGKYPLDIRLDNERFEPINCDQLPIMDHRSDIVLIEFFTHCCINCIHSIEDVREVYEELQSPEVKVISVHSPKFTTERDLQSIKSFVEQYKMDYTSVVNDPGNCLWNELGISCWPTLLILGPNPGGREMNLLFTLMGEGHKDILQTIMGSMLPYFSKRVMSKSKSEDCVDAVEKKENNGTLPAIPRNIEPGEERLRFPGKVAYFDGLLAIADTGNHRILITDTSGEVQHVVGGSFKGFRDGSLKDAKFYLPQGLAFHNQNILYVADTGNHSVRKIDLETKTVTSLICPKWMGVLGDENVQLRSPWDLVFYSENILLVAAAGNHRIFAYFFETTNLFAQEFQKGIFTVIAGSGKEENRNNSYILKASFAQPSGICVLNKSDGVKIICIADSESSSIRAIQTDGKGKVMGLVGGVRDPTNLFAYGDMDGKSFDAKLQHPLGICSNEQEEKLYFVDTYNHKIKVIQLDGPRCNTFSGNGTPGDSVGSVEESKYNEPGGICLDNQNQILYVADTNNHAIKAVDLKTNLVNKINLNFVEVEKAKTKAVCDQTFEVSKTSTQILIKISKVPENWEGGQWTALPHPASLGSKLSQGTISRDSEGYGAINYQIQPENVPENILLVADIFLCGHSACFKRTLKLLIQRSSEEISDPNKVLIYEPSEKFFQEN